MLIAFRNLRQGLATPGLVTSTKPPISRKREGDDVVATSERKVGVTAGGDSYVLLAIHCIGHRRCVDAGTGEERPQNLASRCVMGSEPAIALAREQKPTGSR